MTPTMEEVAGWLREAQEKIDTLEMFSGNCPPRKPVFNDRAAQVEDMGDVLKIIESHVTELAKAIHDAAVLAGICKDDINLSGPELIMLCADMGVVIKAAQVETMGMPKFCDTCEWWACDQILRPDQAGTEFCGLPPVEGDAAMGVDYWGDCCALYSGPKFGCIHHKMKLQPPVNP